MDQDHNDNVDARPMAYERWHFLHTKGTLAMLDNQYDAAASMYEAAALFLYGDDSPAARLCKADSYVGEAIAMIRMHRFQLALELLQVAIELRQGLLPEPHSLHAEAWHQVANALYGLKLYRDANRFYKQAFDCLTELSPVGDDYLRDVIANWMLCLAEMKTMEAIYGAETVNPDIV